MGLTPTVGSIHVFFNAGAFHVGTAQKEGLARVCRAGGGQPVLEFLPPALGEKLGGHICVCVWVEI